MILRNPWLLPVFALSLAACSKVDEGQNDTIPRSKVDARIDNTSLFYPTESQAYLSGDVLTIVGVRNLGTGKESTITMQLKHYKGPATYSIDTATGATYTDLGVMYTADSGVVTIDAGNSEKYAGSFGFRARGTAGTLRVTEGVIEVYK